MCGFGLECGGGDGSKLQVELSSDEVMRHGPLVVVRKLPAAEQVLVSCWISWC